MEDLKRQLEDSKRQMKIVLIKHNRLNSILRIGEKALIIRSLVLHQVFKNKTKKDAIKRSTEFLDNDLTKTMSELGTWNKIGQMFGITGKPLLKLINSVFEIVADKP
jgi:hypothetical protein